MGHSILKLLAAAGALACSSGLAAFAATAEAPGIIYSFSELRKNKNDVREVCIRMTVQKGLGAYEYSDIVRGSATPEVTEVLNRTLPRPVHPQAVRSLCDKLTALGVFKLKSDTRSLIHEYDEYESLELSCQQSKHLFWHSRPVSPLRTEIKRTIMDFVKSEKLDQPPFDVARVYPKRGDTTPAIEMSLADLLTNGPHHANTRVRVRGYYRCLGDTCVLAIAPRYLDKPDYSKWVRVGLPSAVIPAKIPKTLDKKGTWVVIEGYYTWAAGEHTGLFNGTLARITRFELSPR